MKTRIYKKGLVFKPKDKLYISFGDPEPSIYQVIKADKRNNLLEVKVLQENVSQSSKPFTVGQKVNIGEQIFKGFWFFKLERA